MQHVGCILLKPILGRNRAKYIGEILQMFSWSFSPFKSYNTLNGRTILKKNVFSDCVQSDSGAHWASYPMGTGGPFHGSKVTGMKLTVTSIKCWG